MYLRATILSVGAAAILSAIPALAQSQPQSGQQGVQQSGQALAQRSNQQLTQNDREFLKQAAQVNVSEQRLSEIATNKASNQQVQQFAQQLKQDHQSAEQNLSRIAQQVNMQLPKEAEQARQRKIQELQSLSGEQFDRQFVSHIIDEHQKTINRYENQAQQASNPQVKQYAQNQLPVLRDHLERAKDLQQQVGSARG